MIDDIIENGDLVIVNQLTATRRGWGVNNSMKTMVGKEYVVQGAYGTHVMLKHPESGRWTFSIKDLTLVIPDDNTMSEVMPDKVMFDPNELM